MSNLTLGARLRQHRETLGFTIQQVEYLTGISSAFMALLEDDKIGKPAPHILKELAYLYKERVISFLGDECEKSVSSILEPTANKLCIGDLVTIEFIENEKPFEYLTGRITALADEEPYFEVNGAPVDLAGESHTSKIYLLGSKHTDLQTAALKAENAELREALESFNKRIADEISDREAQLNSLSPLGRHALQGPIKAQIALLKDLQQSILSKHKP